jgi:hypothetical protein
VGSEALQVARTSAKAGTTVIGIDVSSIGFGTDQWKSFHSTYNRPVIGEKVAAIVDAWAKAQASHQNVSFVGIGDDAPLVVFAAAVIGTQLTGTVSADFLRADTDSDAYWSSDRYAPGLRAIGDLHSAALVLRDNGLQLFGIRDLHSWSGCEHIATQKSLTSGV